MDTRFMVVTDGQEYASWDHSRGCWATKKKFEGDCLLSEYNAANAIQNLNAGREDGMPEWTAREARVVIE